MKEIGTPNKFGVQKNRYIGSSCYIKKYSFAPNQVNGSPSLCLEVPNLHKGKHWVMTGLGYIFFYLWNKSTIVEMKIKNE